VARRLKFLLLIVLALSVALGQVTVSDAAKGGKGGKKGVKCPKGKKLDKKTGKCKKPKKKKGKKGKPWPTDYRFWKSGNNDVVITIRGTNYASMSINVKIPAANVTCVPSGGKPGNGSYYYAYINETKLNSDGTFSADSNGEGSPTSTGDGPAHVEGKWLGNHKIHVKASVSGRKGMDAKDTCTGALEKDFTVQKSN
jgi:hypothetical protein